MVRIPFPFAAAVQHFTNALARVTGAQVIMAVTEMTDDGYLLHIGPPWTDFPGASVEEDTLRLNRELERWVLRLPALYFWSQNRFKTRPVGEASLY